MPINIESNRLTKALRPKKTKTYNKYIELDKIYFNENSLHP